MKRGAGVLAGTCAGVRPGERVVIVTDEECLGMAEAVRSEAVEAVGSAQAAGSAEVIVSPPRSIDNEEPIPPVSEAMATADVIFLVVTHSLAHTQATREAISKGPRVVSMNAFTERQVQGGGSSLISAPESRSATGWPRRSRHRRAFGSPTPRGLISHARSAGGRGTATRGSSTPQRLRRLPTRRPWWELRRFSSDFGLTGGNLRGGLAAGDRSAIGVRGTGVRRVLVVSQVAMTTVLAVSESDPLMLLAVFGVIGTTALVAAALPALRASRVDPLVALKGD